MQFNLTTFFIEIINFIILIWILKRLLYAPLQKIILKRKNDIKNNLEQVDKLKSEALELERKYNNRLNEWEQEKEKNKTVLHKEILELRAKELQKMDVELEKEQEKAKVILQQKLNEEVKNNTKQAIDLAISFSDKFLKRLADKNLESSMVRIFLSDLNKNKSFQEELNNMILSLDAKNNIYVQTAFELDNEQENNISQNIEKILNKKLDFNFSVNQELLAGIDVQIGSLNLQANLRDELEFFAKVGYGSLNT